MLRRSSYDWPVITADELRDARNRAGFTSQAALAAALGVSERTVTNWEAEGGQVSSRSEATVRALLWPAPGPLSTYSSYELLSELGRRLDRIAEHEVSYSSSNPAIGGHVLDTEAGSVNEVSTGDEQSSSSPAASTARGDKTHKSGPRIVRGRGPRA